MATSLDSIKEETYVTILFADVVGSTHLYEVLGDEDARTTVQQCVTIMKEATEQYGGSVIKTMGDEVMSIFPSADDAMNAASQMQKRITNSDSITPERTHVSIRIGSHYGPVIVEDRDIFGAAVHTANRMTSQAKAGQIITTAVTVEQLSGEWRALARQIDLAIVRGQSDEVAMFEVLWQPEEATSMLPSIMMDASAGKVTSKLYLRVGSEEVVMGEDGLVAATLGRADENDVVVKGKLISRVHARIECDKNRFMLIDKSTNGTFVQREDGEEFYIRRDSTPLSGSGVIGLGKVAAKGSVLAIAYEIL
ncbi:MAG: adenylate/guanylate cyclase domain-containing protein [Gammaproteobacteria bacterium]|jgi:class 3 adenylate cyclase|nr:adenylate/guanylate cyclase domain-containing protein [Chromatiales bacterium]MDP6674065.1 adenylate/guanylate cyclase domain-containing protein [Gammaproteobacteria bacterium]